MCQESGHDSTGCLCLSVSHKASVDVLARAADSPEGLTREGSASKLTHMIVGRIRLFLIGTKLLA